MGRRGFSMIEMIIVVILIGLIAAIGFPRLRDGLEKQNIRSAKALIATLAATARGAAIQRGAPYAFLFLEIAQLPQAKSEQTGRDQRRNDAVGFQRIRPGGVKAHDERERQAPKQG